MDGVVVACGDVIPDVWNEDVVISSGGVFPVVSIEEVGACVC